MANLFKKLVGTGSYETPVYTKSFQGKAIAISEDGLTLAIGAPENDSGIGCCFIYYKDSLSSPWIGSNKLRGSDFKGRSKQGSSISLSADGTILVIGGPGDDDNIGAVWMFKRVEGSWYQTQDKIFSKPVNVNQYFGRSVSLSGDGKTMAIGVPRYLFDVASQPSSIDPIGLVWICSVDVHKKIWEPKTIITGSIGISSRLKSYQGTCVSLSYDGTTLAFSGYADFNQVGDIWVFGFNQNQAKWIEQAHEVFSQVSEPNLARNVNISGDGLTLSFGAYYYDKSSEATFVFVKKDNDWKYNFYFLAGINQKNIPHTPTLSKDGILLAIGAFTDEKDFVLLLKEKYIPWGSWHNLIDPINPINPDIPYDIHYSEGYATVISGNGLSMAIGIHNDSQGTGMVKTYTLKDPITGCGTRWKMSPLIAPDFIGRPGQGDTIVMSEDGLTMFVGGPLDNNGQGSVWIFVRENPDTEDWKQSGEKLVPRDSIGKPNHGYSLALNTEGNILVVGGPGDNEERGALWVYKKAYNGWFYESKLIEPRPSPQYPTTPGSRYGTCVGISEFYG